MFGRLLLLAGFVTLLLPAPAAAAGAPPLVDAAVRGDLAAVRALLKQGTDANAAGGDGIGEAGRVRGCWARAMVVVTGGDSASVPHPGAVTSPAAHSASVRRTAPIRLPPRRQARPPT